MFVCLYMGSSSLYKDALTNFQKASNPKSLVEISTAMHQLTYAMALYYQGYMTQEELDNPNVHGTGTAYYCLDCFFVAMGARIDGRARSTR